MAIKKYFATKNNTITNAFESNLVTRGTGANMGLSDVLEVFSIYGQAIQPSSSAHGRGSEKTSELSRILVHFPVNEISTDRSNENIPASGSVDFYLRLYNAKHGQTTPRSLNIEVAPISKTWEEGFGMDMEEYQDITRDVEGSNWIKSAADTDWTTPGGDKLRPRRQASRFARGLLRPNRWPRHTRRRRDNRLGATQSFRSKKILLY